MRERKHNVTLEWIDEAKKERERGHFLSLAL